MKYFICFLLTFAAFPLFLGPLQFPGDDFHMLEFAANHSWAELLVMFKKHAPLYVHGYDGYSTTRIFEAIIFKIIYSIFGVNPIPFKMMKVLSLSVVSTFIYWVSGSVIGPLLFVTFTGTILSTMWIADSDMVCMAFMAIAFWAFLKKCATT